MTRQVSTITPQKLHDMLEKDRVGQLLDVRSMAEYRAGHIPGAQLIPIEEVSAEAVLQHFKRADLGHEETLYVTCEAGPRAKKAVERLQQAGLDNLTLVEGGTKGWKQAGLPMRNCGNAISLERQVQIAIGALLVMKVWLGFSVHELFFAIGAVIGAGLIVAGTTRWCGMAKLMARMPWNRGTGCAEQAKA